MPPQAIPGAIMVYGVWLMEIGSGFMESTVQYLAFFTEKRPPVCFAYPFHGYQTLVPRTGFFSVNQVMFF